MVESASRVGICLSRCSLRVKDFPQWVHQMVFSVVVVPAGIVSTGPVTRLRLPTSGGRDASCGWPTSAVGQAEAVVDARGRLWEGLPWERRRVNGGRMSSLADGYAVL